MPPTINQKYCAKIRTHFLATSIFIGTKEKNILPQFTINYIHEKAWPSLRYLAQCHVLYFVDVTNIQNNPSNSPFPHFLLFISIRLLRIPFPPFLFICPNTKSQLIVSMWRMMPFGKAFSRHYSKIEIPFFFFLMTKMFQKCYYANNKKFNRLPIPLLFCTIPLPLQDLGVALHSKKRE